MRYFDSGLLLKLYLSEPREREAEQLFSSPPTPPPFTHLHGLEMRSAVRQKLGRGEIDVAEAESILHALNNDLAAGIFSNRTSRGPMSFSRPKVSPPRMAHQRFAGLWTRCTSPWPPFWERASFLHVQRASGPDGCRSRVESNSLIIASPRGSRRLQFQRILRDKQFIALRKNPSPYLDVIEANRTALNTQLAIVRISGQRLVATVSLIKAIGGGWDRSETIALPVTAPIPRRVRIRRR